MNSKALLIGFSLFTVSSWQLVFAQEAPASDNLAQDPDIAIDSQHTQAMLGHGFSEQEAQEAAGLMQRFRHKKRWAKQAQRMLGACLESKACHASAFNSALQVMEEASGQADLDARRVAREVTRALRQQTQDRNKESAQAFRQRLRQRLRLNQAQQAMLQQGQQKKNSYRQNIKGEKSRGGKFGGSESNGKGLGLDKKNQSDNNKPGN